MTYDSESKKRWDKDNVVFIAAKIFTSKQEDAELLAYVDSLTDKSKGIGRGTIIKLALREYMENHGGEST